MNIVGSILFAALFLLAIYICFKVFMAIVDYFLILRREMTYWYEHTNGAYGMKLLLFIPYMCLWIYEGLYTVTLGLMFRHNANVARDWLNKHR